MLMCESINCFSLKRIFSCMLGADATVYARWLIWQTKWSRKHIQFPVKYKDDARVSDMWGEAFIKLTKKHLEDLNGYKYYLPHDLTTDDRSASDSLPFLLVFVNCSSFQGCYVPVVVFFVSV